MKAWTGASEKCLVNSVDLYFGLPSFFKLRILIQSDKS